MSIKRKITWILIICLFYITVTTCIIVSYAYFSKKEIYDGYFSGQVELLFDRLDDDGITAYQNALTEEYKKYGENVTVPKVDKNATWGSEAYPFVISNVRHLYNLSELQRLGYFHKKFISQNADGTYSNVPYFLVCTPKYKPVLINGTNFKNITAIGTDDYPFIGSVKGVKSTTADVSNINVYGKTCDTSTIHNVTVAGNPKNVDVGLFGVIGYLGTEPKPTTQPDGTIVQGSFEGHTSTVSNLVLSDIQVVVNSSFWDDVAAFVGDIMVNAADGHKYSFSELYNTEDYNKVPHENHHIGILAGHASYATIEFISVYYSADTIVAINLSDKTVVSGTNANYLSATGILGFIDNINPKITIGENGKQTITAGSGDSLGDISYGSVGGGGTSSGEKAGYVLASEMYNKFHFTKAEDGTYTEDTSGTIKIKDALDENGKSLCQEWVRDRILWGTENTGRYYFYDGVFTFALSDQSDQIEPTWNIKTDKDGNPVKDEKGNVVYDVPDFSLGQNTNIDKTWKTNNSKGNKAAVAYVKEIKSIEELNQQNGKDIFILAKNSDGSVFLMTLYKESTANFKLLDISTWGDNNYTTDGMQKSFASDALVTSLIESIDAGNEETPSFYDGMTTDLASKSLKVLNLGTATDLDTLQKQYRIKVSSQSSGNFIFSTIGENNKENKIGLIVRRSLGMYFNNIYCGNSYSDFRAHTEEAMLTCSNDANNPYFTFKYETTYSSNTYTRYVRYDSENLRFTSASNESETTRLYLYSIVGMSNINFGRITFDPIDDPASATDSYTFSAGTHVLKATSTHTKNGNNIATTTTSYAAVPLKTEGKIQGLDWNNGAGVTLSQADLLKKFKMTKGITFGASFNLFNGTLGSSGIITAPVGTDGVEANIPMACVAFKINKPVEAAKIRVIVSVAVSEYYPGEKDGDVIKYELGDYTRYFNLWKMEAAGESIVQVFNATGSNLLDRFEVPRSHPYEPGTAASATTSEYITVNYNGEDYRCYLNGDRVLVAYEFTVNTTDTGTGAGVYCLGMSGIDKDGNVVSDVPMEIVYFSADGVASAGRDGATGSQIGTIDFVYDYGDKIVTVMESSSTDVNGKEDYNTYYPSYCLLYFDHKADDYTSKNPKYVDVNNEVVIIRRYVADIADSDANHNDTQSLSTLKFKLEGDGHVKVVQYSRVADNVQQTQEQVSG